MTLTGPFYISDHEVTVGEYKACIVAGGRNEPGSGTYSDNLNLLGQQSHLASGGHLFNLEI